MKKLLITLGMALAAVAAQAADVGVSVSVGQPGFYGRIDVGRFPAPAVIYAEPVMVQRVYGPPPPVYLRVPPGHYRHWARHCGRYGACGRPVYFVREDWYARHYQGGYGGYDRPHGHVVAPAYRPGPPPHWHGDRWDDRRGHGHRDRDERRGRDGRDGRDGWREHGDRHERHHHPR